MIESAADGFELDIKAGDFYVAAIPDVPGRTVANAHLIAAAPEMLQVLEDVLASADAEMEPFDMDEVARVVGKAKGRSDA